jgi:hypothetical protein
MSAYRNLLNNLNHSEDTAHEAFVQMLQATAIPYAKRQRLIHQYDLWRDSKGEEFWADRAAAHRARVSRKNAFDKIIKGSDILRARFINASSYSALQVLSPISSNVTSSQGNDFQFINILILVGQETLFTSHSLCLDSSGTFCYHLY